MLPWKQCPVDACVTKWTELNDCKFLLQSFLSIADTIQHMHYKNTARPYRQQIYTMSYMLLTGKKYVQVHIFMLDMKKVIGKEHFGVSFA